MRFRQDVIAFHPNLLPWLQLDLAIGANLHQRLPDLLHDTTVAHLRLSMIERSCEGVSKLL